MAALSDVHIMESTAGWRGCGGCCACWQGLFWGHPANRDTFLITVRNLVDVFTFRVCKPPDQVASMPDL